MSVAAASVIFSVGLIAGIFNSVVGFGTSITFPALVLLGYPPLVSNTSNKVGLLPGILTGIAGYRHELAPQRGNIARVAVIGVVGGVGGGLLLVALPHRTFTAAAPLIILASTLLFIGQPLLARRARSRAPRRQGPGQEGSGQEGSGREGSGRGPLAIAVVGALYGGYFGAGQGVIYITALSTMVPQSLQRVIALKNVLGAVVVTTSSLLFLAVAPVDLLVALFLAIGSSIGGYVGAVVGRRLPETALRVVVIVVSLAATAVLLT
jgi:uncharacterized membrane protein YfcA